MVMVVLEGTIIIIIIIVVQIVQNVPKTYSYSECYYRKALHHNDDDNDDSDNTNNNKNNSLQESGAASVVTGEITTNSETMKIVPDDMLANTKYEFYLAYRPPGTSGLEKYSQLKYSLIVGCFYPEVNITDSPQYVT